jgi:hypothetical protein
MPGLKMMPTYVPEPCKARAASFGDEVSQLGIIVACMKSTVLSMINKAAGAEVAESCKWDLQDISVENYDATKDTIIGKLSGVKSFKQQEIVSMIDKLKMAVAAYEPAKAAYNEAHPPLKWSQAGKRKTKRSSKSKRGTRRTRR